MATRSGLRRRQRSAPTPPNVRARRRATRRPCGGFARRAAAAVTRSAAAPCGTLAVRLPRAQLHIEDRGGAYLGKYMQNPGVASSSRRSGTSGSRAPRGPRENAGAVASAVAVRARPPPCTVPLSPIWSPPTCQHPALRLRPPAAARRHRLWTASVAGRQRKPARARPVRQPRPNGRGVCARALVRGMHAPHPPSRVWPWAAGALLLHGSVPRRRRLRGRRRGSARRPWGLSRRSRVRV